jgi:CBS domain containing-hemolysin-like protein
MPDNHPLIPRALIILIATVIMMALLAGILQAFAPARAAAMATTNIMALATSTPIVSDDQGGTGAPILIPADTTGIIALAIILVVIIIFGTMWGRRTALRRMIRK